LGYPTLSDSCYNFYTLVWFSPFEAETVDVELPLNVFFFAFITTIIPKSRRKPLIYMGLRLLLFKIFS
ncbi:hypothetical protein, partial [Weissella cibaria]|uniref:hypothetical protein n=1 Tax=Weissella cibaria TaxID=137591 RepID=UPI001F2FA6DA